MRNVSATDAARRFSEMLDAVEARRETFVIVRKGKPVARVGPVAAANGKAVKELLRGVPRDRAWAEELRELRAALTIEERAWSG